LAGLPENRHADLTALHTAIRRTAPRLRPHLAYAGTMIGDGPYHHTSATGREGDSPIVALSSRAQYISLDVIGHRGGQSIAEVAKAKLGKVSVGSVASVSSSSPILTSPPPWTSSARPRLCSTTAAPTSHSDFSVLSYL
jgi:hypothetical protein